MKSFAIWNTWRTELQVKYMTVLKFAYVWIWLASLYSQLYNHKVIRTCTMYMYAIFLFEIELIWTLIVLGILSTQFLFLTFAASCETMLYLFIYIKIFFLEIEHLQNTIKKFKKAKSAYLYFERFERMQLDCIN